MTHYSLSNNCAKITRIGQLLSKCWVVYYLATQCRPIMYRHAVPEQGKQSIWETAEVGMTTDARL